MQSIEEKIYEVFWDKNIARMINRADLFSFLKQYVNPGLLTRSSKSELVHDLKEYMTTANLEFIAERMESFGLPMVDTVSVLDTTSQILPVVHEMSGYLVCMSNNRLSLESSAPRTQRVPFCLDRRSHCC